jgi:3-deoxy-manno-octulosonate cytidylyltransferase (CMP-KDO synthetase)
MAQPAATSVPRATSLIVIPARLNSSRLPGKMLLRETGRSLIHHTYLAAGRAGRPMGVVVATDAEEIQAEVRSFGGKVQMTSAGLNSGTDRVAEVARRLPDVEIVVNVQGDEPEISGQAIDDCIALLERHSEASVATLATPIRCRGQLEDPACVKVVFDGRGMALYFSRSVIPHPRRWDDALLAAEPPLFHQHVGLYAYRRDFLLRLAAMPQTDLERTESLEQLRVLHAGEKIAVGVIDEPTRGIDTPQDYAAFVERCRRI